MNTLDSIIKRKSVRSFNNEQISEEQLEKLIQAAKAAPISGGGRADSARHIAVVQNVDVLKDLSDVVAKLVPIPSPNPLYGTKTLIVFSAPSNQFKAEQLDVALSAQNVSIAATGMGLNSIIMTGPVYAFNASEELKSKLNIPEGYTPYISIAVGNTDDTSVKTREFDDTNVSYIL